MIYIDEKKLQFKYIKEGMRLGLDKEEATSFVLKLWPEIVIGEERNGVVDFRITPTPFANLASCCIGADANYLFHTGRRAINQSSVLISICCAVVCRYAGGVLLGIAPDVTFDNPLKVGESAIIFASKENWEQSRIRETRLRGETSSGQTLFGTRIITTRTPRGV